MILPDQGSGETPSGLAIIARSGLPCYIEAWHEPKALDARETRLESSRMRQLHKVFEL
jgi:hypothetical protein